MPIRRFYQNWTTKRANCPLPIYTLKIMRRRHAPFPPFIHAGGLSYIGAQVMQALGEDPEKGPTPAQKEVLQLFSKLSRKLDSLSNFHYTPKPPLPELEVRKSVAAINMEEVLYL